MEKSNSPSNTQELDGHQTTTQLPELASSQAGVQQRPEQLDSPPKRRRRTILLILLGVGAIAASIFGYRWWRYASTHVDTDDAYVAGHVHQLNARINNTVAKVLVDDNQLVHQGQLLVHLDRREYQVQVQQAEADLEAARRQASAASSNITVAATNAQGQTTQAQGNISAAVATISTNEAAVAAASAGITAAQA